MKQAQKLSILSPLSILKVWSEGFGVKVDDYKRKEIENLNVAYNRYSCFSEEVVMSAIEGKTTETYKYSVSNAIEGCLSGLHSLLKSNVQECLTAEESQRIIWQDMYSCELSIALHFIHLNEPYLPSLLSLMVGNESNYALKVTIQSLEKEPIWNEFVATLQKSDKDKIRKWTISALPSIKKIQSLLDSPMLDEETRRRFMTMILHARLVDSIKEKGREYELSNIIRQRLLNYDFKSHAEALRWEICQKHESYFIKSQEMIKKARQVMGTPGFIEVVDNLKRDFDGNSRGWVYSLHCEHLLACHLLLNGELGLASKLYKKVIEYSGAFSRIAQTELLFEALSCASIAGKKGDAVLLKRAKNLGIVWGIMDAHDHPDEWPIAPHKELSDFVKPYEIEEYQQFLKKRMPDAKVDFDKVPSPYLIFDTTRQKLQSANRRSRIGTSNVLVEQLTQAIMLREYNTIKTMLDKARVARDIDHTRGRSPLIVALQNLCDTQSDSDRDVVILLIEKLEGEGDSFVRKLLNNRTDKKKITALSLAIDSYDPKIVHALLRLGADPNLRSSPEFKSPLLHALRRAGDCKFNQNLSIHLNCAREIVVMLLQFKAKPNATYDYDRTGYTAAMLAVELDEVEILNLLDDMGADLAATYFDEREGEYIGLEKIAKYFNAESSAEYLNQVLRNRCQ